MGRTRADRRTGFTPLVLLPLAAACGSGSEAPPTGPPAPQVIPCDAAPLALTVGDAVPLPAVDSTCVRLPEGSGRYGLAFVDVRPQRQSQDAPESSLRSEPPGRFRLRVAGASATAPSSAGVVGPIRHADGAGGQPTAHVRHVPTPRDDCARGDDIFCQDGPWSEGDSIDAYMFGFEDEGPRHIVWLVEGPFTFVSTPGAADHYATQWQEELRDIVRAAGDVTLGLLDASFNGERPVTINSGQIVLRVRPPESGSASTISVWLEEESTVRYFVSLELPLVPGGSRPSASQVSRATEVFVHEHAHGWQYAHLRAERPVGGIGVNAWGGEGGAQFFTQEVIRATLGLPLDAQLDLDLAEADDLQGYLLRRILSGSGRILEGYDDAASFFRHLLHDALLSGAGYQEAMAAILGGSIEGWHGNVSELGAYRGLTERMSELLGRTWEPETALLEWVAAHAADDRTSEPRLQVPLLEEAWRNTPWNSWPAAATISLTPGFPRVLELEPGAAGYALLLAGGGESIHLWNEEPGLFRWLLVRLE